MIKLIYKVLKKVIMAFLIIYAYNSLGIPNNLLIPMNIFTIFLVFKFNFIGLIGLILFKIINFG